MILQAHLLDTDMLSSDVAVIGAGPAGLCIADALARAGHEVLLIESGGEGIDLKRDQCFAAEIAGEPMDAETVRVRTFGGATALWTGRCGLLDPEDFAPHPFIANSGWPIAPDALDRFVEQAAQIIGLNASPVRRDQRLEQLSASFAGDAALCGYRWSFAPTGRDEHLHFGDAFWDQTAASSTVRCLLECDCVGLEGEGGRVSAARLVDRTGRSLRLEARQFVLASGTIESVRLLLLLARTTPSLLAQVQPWLGRGFMQHLRVVAAQVEATPVQADKLQASFNRFRRPHSNYEEMGIGTLPAWRAEAEAGNVVGYFRYHRVRCDPPQRWTEKALRYVLGREPRLYDPRISLVVDAEQAPDPRSQITLSNHLDCHGNPRARIDWQIGSLERRTVRLFAQQVARWIADAGLGRVMLDPGVIDERLPPDILLDSLHHLGGARMGRTAADSVVDSDLRVHGTNNLFVCSGAVFPTGGHINPTTILIALAFRLAERLARQNEATG